MNRQKWVMRGLCLILLFSWGYFCITEIPQLQQRQREESEAKAIQVLKKNQFLEHIIIVKEQMDIVVQENEIDVVKESMYTEEVVEEKKNYSDADLQLLARLIESEGGITNYQCKLYIGSVVLNRMASDRYPNTLEEVIFDRKPCVQFSVIIKNKKGHRPIDCTPSKDSLKAAEELLTNGTQLPEDILVFYAESVSGNWVNTRKTYTHEDGVIFAYD